MNTSETSHYETLIQKRIEKEKKEEWFSAARQGSLETLQRILSNNPPYLINIDETDRDGKTALANATENGNTHVVKWLLEQGADVNHYEQQYGLEYDSHDVFYYSPYNMLPSLMIAIAKNHPEYFELLLSTETIRHPDTEDETPLSLCIRLKRVRFVERILEMNSFSSEELKGPLAIVIYYLNHCDIDTHTHKRELILKLLLEHGAVVEPNHMENTSEKLREILETYYTENYVLK